MKPVKCDFFLYLYHFHRHWNLIELFSIQSYRFVTRKFKSIYKMHQAKSANSNRFFFASMNHKFKCEWLKSLTVMLYARCTSKSIIAEWERLEREGANAIKSIRYKIKSHFNEFGEMCVCVSENTLQPHFKLSYICIFICIIFFQSSIFQPLLKIKLQWEHER